MTDSPPPVVTGRMVRTLGLWALLIIGSIALVKVASAPRDRAEITFSRFTQEVETGNVATLAITDGRNVRGTFRTPVSIHGRSSSAFATLLPFAASDAWIQELRAKGTEVRTSGP